MPSALQCAHASRSLAGLAILLILLSTNLLSQSPPMPATPVASHPVVDSAAAARQRYQAAVTQLRAGNLSKAMELAATAQSAWPAQPAYLAAVASLAARAGDTVRAIQALDQLATLGGAHPVARDPAFEAIRQVPGLVLAVERMAARTGAWPKSSPAATLGPDDFFAEGVARSTDGTFYVGSVRQRRILRVTAEGVESPLTGPGDSLWAVSGIVLAPDGRSLWVSSNAIPQMERFDSPLDGRAELVRVSLDGRVLQRIPVPAGAGGAMVGDLLVAPDGGLYASDTRGQAIWYLAAGASAPRLVARHPLLRSPQGMVLAASGGHLLVADYSHGVLRVDPASGSVEALPAPVGTTTLGIDGLARHGRDLIAIQNGGVVPRVVRLRLDPTERRIVAVEVLDRNLAVADEPTLGVVAGDEFFYVANSQWEKRGDDGQPIAGAALTRTVILRLPLR